MNKILNKDSGFTLIELVFVCVILGVILGIIFFMYSDMLKHLNSIKKSIKADTDIKIVSWTFLKEIESAGFGVPLPIDANNACTNPIQISNSELIIHSTVSGDAKNSGRWSIIGLQCGVTGIDNGEYIVIINPQNKTRLAKTRVSSGKLNGCQENVWKNMFAYWIPSDGNLECYETRFAKRNYTGDRPYFCAANSSKFSRSVSKTFNSTNYQPITDCILDADYKLGCQDSNNGNIIWQSDTNCSNNGNILKFVKIEIIYQDGAKNKNQSSPAELIMFEDMGSQLQKKIVLTDEQRFYKWKVLEKTITLRNLE